MDDVQCLENGCFIYFVCFYAVSGGRANLVLQIGFVYILNYGFCYDLCFKLAVNFYHVQMILTSLYSSYSEDFGCLGISEDLLEGVSVPLLAPLLRITE